MGETALIRIATATLLIVVAIVEIRLRGTRAERPVWLARFLTIFAAGSIGLLVVTFLSHLRFPLALKITEGAVLQHLERLASGQPIYAAPSPEFVALAYNPLYFYVSLPVGWVFGETLFTLRLVSVLAYALCAVVIYRVIHDKTGSVWAGFITVGLFAAGYDAMDAGLDAAKADSCMLAAVLIGTYIIDLNKSRAWNIFGVLILIASFWFKQHGALFTAAAVVYLTWREGPARAWIYWVLAALLGPGIYFALGPALFGSHYHFYTWEVPNSWSTPTVAGLRRILVHALVSYPLLMLVALGAVWQAGKRAVHGEKTAVSIWYFQLGAGIGSSLLSMFDLGSSDNVFTPMATMALLNGAMALFRIEASRPAIRRLGLVTLALLLSFAALMYDPRTNILAFDAQTTFDDFVAEMESLDGTVYAPNIGNLDSEFDFYPEAHWVAIEDIIRGDRGDERMHLADAVLADVEHPSGNAYVLTFLFPTEMPDSLKHTLRDYVLVADYGDRFQDLRVPDHRWSFDWPRYLFRYDPAAAQGDSLTAGMLASEFTNEDLNDWRNRRSEAAVSSFDVANTEAYSVDTRPDTATLSPADRSLLRCADCTRIDNLHCVGEDSRDSAGRESEVASTFLARRECQDHFYCAMHLLMTPPPYRGLESHPLQALTGCTHSPS